MFDQGKQQQHGHSERLDKSLEKRDTGPSPSNRYTVGPYIAVP